ncbi:amidase [Ramlibacter solisilvae]|uniref:Amidase n=1 Tax=Ramlibacter tataouinensis TaxID=94132 RepID=A0A127JVF6_9BURK|nr:amidase [Ramlibacter tataouinensis]AMO22002.1 amidase [Ramlibacter tataouinensis]
MADLTNADASTLGALLQRGEVSCLELMRATLDRIHARNPVFNAIVNLAPDEVLLAAASAADEELKAGRLRGWLHGIPIAIKDASDALGFPTTKGCELLARNKPPRDSIMTARMKAAGCIVIGKTTTPELGLGSHTFSTLWGATGNGWDPAVSAGGSSGGAATCLAQRMLPIADGSDFMGSLRNPAGWNHVYGMRPTQGRVPQAGNPDVWIDMLSTEGPMGRSIDDVARLLVTQSGHDARSPLSLQSPLEWNGETDPALLRGLKIGWLADIGGHLATEPGVLEACRDALRHFESAGAVVEQIPLGFDAAKVWECWLTWRRAIAGPRVGALMQLPGAKEKIKPEAQWEYECSLGLSYMEFRLASQVRSAFYQHMRTLFERWDVLVLPSAQCWPFDVSWRWPKEIAGRAMDTYHRWMEVTIYATLAGCPSLVVPAGFHPNGKWPMGMQLIGPYGADAFVLRVGKAYEGLRRDFIALRPAE